MQEVSDPRGIPLIAFTREEIRVLNRAAISQYGIPAAALMESAGRAAAAIVLNMLPAQPSRVLIVCGKGNNSGDGYVVARYLHNAGHHPHVFLAADAASIGGCAASFLRVMKHMNVSLTQVSQHNLDVLVDAAVGAALIVDGLFGTGLSGNVRASFDSIIKILNASGKPILSIDIPSGLDADTGQALGVAVRATQTATFAGAKVGFFRGQGPLLTGRVHVVDIGIPRNAYETLGVKDYRKVFATSQHRP